MNRWLMLDTHALLWWMNDSPELSPRIRAAIEDREQAILISAATLWEIAIKQRKGTLAGCEEYLASFGAWHDRWGFSTLALEPEHVVLAGSLAWAHRDPFDRALVAQSQIVGANLATSDADITAFHTGAIW